MPKRTKQKSNILLNYALVTVISAAIALVSGISCNSGKGEVISDSLSQAALDTADYALQEYRDDIIETLAKLVTFKTVYVEGVPAEENPEFIAITEYLKQKAAELGFDFQDFGAAVVIGLGEAEKRYGVVTHADVQPADPSKWTMSPFVLDRTTDATKLIGRGTEDDKGPIAIALYSMKALADKGLPLKRRIELIIAYTEESDWTPFQNILRTQYKAPEINVALDSMYPVVTAEKGWCMVQVALPITVSEPGDARPRPRPYLRSFSGGVFLSQVPEDAVAVISKADDEFLANIRQAAAADGDVTFNFDLQGDILSVTALGKSAHSSEPEEGVNAITHMAALLGNYDWPTNAAAQLVTFINDLVGTGFYAEKFGDIAYEHDFMGRLTLSLGLLQENDGNLVLGINLRRPAGKENRQLEKEIRDVLAQWQEKIGLESLNPTIYIGDPHYIETAPHIQALLRVYGHYTGTENPQPVSAGGGTHARILPNGVSFGPHMPGRAYSGHSEHEFLLLEELDLDIKMYTAMLVEIAVEK